MGGTDFTRREVLAALLGVPIALSACRNGNSPSLPDGEIVGASDAFGHQLRERISAELPDHRIERSGVVIIGAGIAGLSAARRFIRAGFEDFTIVELEPEPGGTSRSGTSPIVAFPWGAHYLPAPMKENRPLLSLLDEMGVLEGEDESGEPVVAEHFLCRDPEERTFYKGRWYEGLYLHDGASAEDRAQLDAFNGEVNRWVGWRDSKGRRAFAIPTAASSDDSAVTELDKITMADWMSSRGFTSARLRWWVDYGCRDDYGMTIDTTSAWAGLFYFASRVVKPGTESQPFITWPEGNGRLVSHLYSSCRAKVRLGVAAVEIVPAVRDGRPVVDVLVLDRNQKTAGLRADQAVFAAPHFLTRHVIRDYRDNPPSHVSDFEYGAWMVANLMLSGRPRHRGFPPAWDNVLYESPSLGYVVATHQRGMDHGPTVFTYYYPLCDEDPKQARAKLLGADWSQWADVALTDLRRAHQDIDELVERLDVMRWGHAMIRPRPGFIWGRSRSAAAKPFRGIHFAHSDLSGIAIFEEAFYQGIRAAEEVLKVRGQLTKSEL